MGKDEYPTHSLIVGKMPIPSHNPNPNFHLPQPSVKQTSHVQQVNNGEIRPCRRRRRRPGWQRRRSSTTGLTTTEIAGDLRDLFTWARRSSKVGFLGQTAPGSHSPVPVSETIQEVPETQFQTPLSGRTNVESPLARKSSEDTSGCLEQVASFDRPSSLALAPESVSLLEAPEIKSQSPNTGGQTMCLHLLVYAPRKLRITWNKGRVFQLLPAYPW